MSGRVPKVNEWKISQNRNVQLLGLVCESAVC